MPRPRPYTVGFYLLPGFPMMACASAIEPLRAANRLSGEKLYDWQLFSRDGDPVRASNRIDIAVDGSLHDEPALDHEGARGKFKAFPRSPSALS